MSHPLVVNEVDQHPVVIAGPHEPDRPRRQSGGSGVAMRRPAVSPNSWPGVTACAGRLATRAPTRSVILPQSPAPSDGEQASWEHAPRTATPKASPMACQRTIAARGASAVHRARTRPRPDGPCEQEGDGEEHATARRHDDDPFDRARSSRRSTSRRTLACSGGTVSAKSTSTTARSEVYMSASCISAAV